MTGSISLASSLCLDCGLCCNGTIYGFIELEGEDRNCLTGTDARIQDHDQGARLLFPCALLDGAACTIYRNRPSVCQAFSCTVLNQVADGAIDEAEARRRIAEAKAAAARAEPEYLPGETPAEARYRWFAINREPPIPADARFNLLMTALNLVLDRYFRWPDRKRVEFKPDS